MADALLLVDMVGNVTKANRAAEALLGLNVHQITGTPISRVLGIPGVPSTPSELLERYAGNRYLEADFVTQDGRRVPLGINCDLVRDKRRNLTGLLLVVRDLTERKRAEITERLAATGRLAASIAHEINNPLEAVTNLLFLANSDPSVSESVQRYLNHADQELGRVVQIAQQTLRFYRDTTSPVPTNIPQVLDSVLDLYSRKMSYKKLRIERRYQAVTEIYSLLGEVRQVFSNLLANAIDASSDECKLVLRVKPGREWKHGRGIGIRVTIADQGTGIPAALRTRVFEPFFSTKQDVGTGLGLWITKSLIEKHGGSIRFRSSIQPGRTGTMFSVFLPTRPSPTAAHGGLS
jgi:PAS domain S-box-containing protein